MIINSQSIKLFAAPELTAEELAVSGRITDLRKRLRHLTSEPKRWTGLLRRTAFARAIAASNSIEGYDVGRDDAVAAAEGDEPFDSGGEPWKAVVGYRQAMTYVLGLAEDDHFVFGPNILRSLHFMMTEYDLGLRPGQWRLGPIYVRREPSGQIVYEGPDAELVPKLVDALVEWINEGDLESPPTVRAAMGHLNLVMVHPFKDGNGRMARCLQALMLAREGILAPPFCSIEEYLRDHTEDYYAVLGEVGAGKWNPDRDARPWVRFVLTAHFRQADNLLRRREEMAGVFDGVEEISSGLGLPERSLVPLVNAAYGFRLRNSVYRRDADVSNGVATRDLKRLAQAGLLVAHGERRGRFYVGSDELKRVRNDLRKPRSELDPFER